MKMRNVEERTCVWLVATGLAAMAALVGCATSGTAEGELVEEGHRQEPVVFDWESSEMDPVHGQIRTRMPDGKRYTGSYFEITRTVEEQDLDPLWDGWDPYWGMNDFDEFQTEYSGRVVANLQSEEGQRMRCQFRLSEPEDGMAGGGVGECTLPGGERIANVVLGEGRERERRTG